MKNAMLWLYYSFDSIMNLKYNPFRYIGNISLQYYFMTALSLVWTMAFCGLIAGWSQILPLIYGHVGVLAAIFLTYGTFKDAERGGYVWFQKWDERYTLAKAYANRDKTKNSCRWDLEIEA
jgi:hypothetical protein